MWLYLPTSCRSALAGEDSTSGSDSLFQTLAQSATWKTKSLPPRSWQRTWQRNKWLPHLFGLTYEPSMRERGVESWISSLAATRASRSALPASSVEPTIPATSGPTCEESWQMLSPSGASSRTSALICDSEDTKSPESYKAWATALRAFCLQRRKSARLTAASGCSSLRAWQTPAVFQGKYRRQVGQTERAEELLPAQAETATGSAVGRLPGQTALGIYAREWPTPRTITGGAESAERKQELGRTNGLLGRQAPRMPMDGDESSPGVPTSPRRLNPRFVEWLMGWPENHVSVDLTSSTSWGME
jgi:hypothetical protein